MPMPKFTIAQTTRFIELYRAHPCLWQSDTKAYRDKVLRKIAIEEIVAEMNMSDFKFVDCQIKIKNIRSHYLQELKKIYNYNIRGSRKGELYKPTLCWFNLIDSFLWNYIVHQSPILLSLKKDREIKHDPPTNPLETNGLGIKKEAIDLEDDVASVASWNVDDITDENDDITASCNTMLYEESDKSTEYTLAPSRRTSNNHESNIGFDTVTSDSKMLIESESEFDIFGRGVAAQLKSIPLIEAVQLQLKIQQLITEHRLKLFMSQVPSNIE